MARDSGGGAEQKRRTTGKQDAEHEEAQASPDIQEKGEELKEELDALLDEIDDVLEENAEEFVKQNVHKGGEEGLDRLGRGTGVRNPFEGPKLFSPSFVDALRAYAPELLELRAAGAGAVPGGPHGTTGAGRREGGPRGRGHLPAGHREGVPGRRLLGGGHRRGGRPGDRDGAAVPDRAG